MSVLSVFIFFLLFLDRCYVAQAGPFLCFPSAWVTGVCHHTQLLCHLSIKRKASVQIGHPEETVPHSVSQPCTLMMSCRQEPLWPKGRYGSPLSQARGVGGGAGIKVIGSLQMSICSTWETLSPCYVHNQHGGEAHRR